MCFGFCLKCSEYDKFTNTTTTYDALNKALKYFKNNKSDLLKVLENPSIPLHNNLSERDIRDYVKKRKISGSTRSENGRKARDTFASLKKTCKKLAVSFNKYLQDRISGKNDIENLGESIRLAYASGGWGMRSYVFIFDYIPWFISSLP